MSSSRPLRDVLRTAVAAAAALAVLVPTTGPAQAAGTTTVLPEGGPAVGQVLFDEGFDGTSLDRASWGTCYGYRASDCTNEFNREEQVYVDDAITVGDGEARLTARKETRTGYLQNGEARTFGHASGLISTEGRFSFTYGYAEFRAWVPKGQGLWPAVWMLPDSKRWPPEIDVMEYIGSQPDRVYMTRHTPDGPAKSSAFIGPDFSQGWHTFAVDWRKDALVWYVDGVERFRVTDGVPAEPMYLLANLAVGGTWPGSPDATTAFPATLRLDSVRVWASADTVLAPVGTPVTPLPEGDPLHPASWTSSWSGAAIDGGAVELPVTRSYPTATSPRSDLRGKAVSARVAAPGPGGDSELGLVVGDDLRHAAVVQAGSDLLMRAQADGGLTSTLVRFDPVRHRTWRIRDDAGTTVWETSPDGATWTVQRRAAVGLDLSDAHIRMRAGTWAASDTTTTAVLDQLAVESATAPAPTVEPSPTASPAPSPTPTLSVPTPSPSPTTLLTASGPTSIPAGTALAVKGQAAPRTPVELRVRKSGSTTFTTVAKATSDRLGAFTLSTRPRTDVAWYVRSGTTVTPTTITTLTPTLDGPKVRLVAKNAVTVLTGRAAPRSTVTLRFTRVRSGAAVVRTVKAGANGRWIRPVRSPVDQRVVVKARGSVGAASLLRAR